MKTAAHHLPKRAGLSAVAVAALLTAAGCSAINPPATTTVYSASDGIVTDVGDMELSNILVVATGADEPGRVLGTLANNSDRELTLTMDAPRDTVEVQVPAGGTVRLEDSAPVILRPVGTGPGLMLPVEFRAGDATQANQVPVLDHTFPRYAEFVPGGAPSTPANPSNTPVPLDEMVGQEGGH